MQKNKYVDTKEYGKVPITKHKINEKDKKVLHVIKQNNKIYEIYQKEYGMTYAVENRSSH